MKKKQYENPIKKYTFSKRCILCFQYNIIVYSILNLQYLKKKVILWVNELWAI